MWGRWVGKGGGGYRGERPISLRILLRVKFYSCLRLHQHMREVSGCFFFLLLFSFLSLQMQYKRALLFIINAYNEHLCFGSLECHAIKGQVDSFSTAFQAGVCFDPLSLTLLLPCLTQKKTHTQKKKRKEKDQ